MKIIRSRSSQSPSPAFGTSSILTSPPEDQAPRFSDTRNFTGSQLESSSTAARSTTITAQNSVKLELSDTTDEGIINNSNSATSAATNGSLTGIFVNGETRGAYSAREESLQREIVYKRPDTINRQSIVSVHYKVSVLEVVRERLVSVGGQALLDKFVAGCFGHLINWMPGNKCSMALHHVLSREINMTGAKDHEMWFHINGTNLRFSYPEYALVTGLNFGPSNFSPTADYDLQNVQVYTRFCNGTQTRVADLLERFSNKHAQIDDPDGDLYLRIAHVLVLYIFLFGSDHKKHVEPWVWKLVDDLEMFGRYPWGAHTYLTLKHYVKNVICMPKYHIYGPLWALNIWSLEAIPELANAVGTLVDPAARPRCMRWKLQDIRSIPKLDPIFGLKAAPHAQLVPDDDERNTFYWHSTQSPYALSVEFVEPRVVGASDPSMPASRETRRHGSRTRDSGKRHRESSVEFVEPHAVGVSDPSMPASRRGSRTRDSGKRHGELVSSLTSSDSEFTEMVIEKLNKRLMPRFTKFFEDLIDAVQCGCSRPIPPFVLPPPCTLQSPIREDADQSKGRES